MFTVLSNTRNMNLYVIIVLAVVMAVLLTFVVVPAISAPKSAVVPVTGISEYADYYQRHPEIRLSAGMAIDTTDYFARHPELLTPSQPNDLSDYFLRH